MSKKLEDVVNQIHCIDVVEGMKQIPDDSVSLIFTSPPYNVNIDYGTHEDDAAWNEYLNWLKEIWIQSHRILRTGGRLAINIDSIVNHEDDNDKEYYRPIYADLVNQMRQIDGMNFRTEICWYKQNTVGRKTAWGSFKSCSNPITRRNHEYILVWSKDSWQLPKLDYESDLTKSEFTNWICSTWHISPETQNRGGHPVPFPEELARRVIKMYCYPNDIVLDPFNGSGTTTKVALALGRQYIGVDLDEKYCAYAKRRLEEGLAQQKLEKQMLEAQLEQEKKVKDKKNTPEVDIFGG